MTPASSSNPLFVRGAQRVLTEATATEKGNKKTHVHNLVNNPQTPHTDGLLLHTALVQHYTRLNWELTSHLCREHVVQPNRFSSFVLICILRITHKVTLHALKWLNITDHTNSPCCIDPHEQSSGAPQTLMNKARVPLTLRPRVPHWLTPSSPGQFPSAHSPAHLWRFSGRHPWVSPKSSKDYQSTTRFRSETYLLCSTRNTQQTARQRVCSLASLPPALLPFLYEQHRLLTDCQSASSRGQIGDSCHNIT